MMVAQRLTDGTVHRMKVKGRTKKKVMITGISSFSFTMSSYA